MAETQNILTHPYRDIYEQFVDEASFLWLLRSVALTQPHYLPSDLAELEQRIDNNLDGLFSSPDDVWGICESAMELEEPGEIFTSAIFAFRSLEVNKVQKVVEIGLANVDTFDGLVSAIAWLPDNISKPWLKKFLRSKELDHKYLAVAVLSALREDPGEYLLTMLKREDCRKHEKLYARCMRLVGELKRKDLVPALDTAMNMDSELIAFWARWSAILLGNRTVVRELVPLVSKAGPFQEKATSIYFRTVPVDEAKQLISSLAKLPGHTRIVIKACAALGDPQVMPWLFRRMAEPEHARLAAEAFTQITGIHLEENKLNIDVPELTEVPNDNPEDDNIDLDEDENLPWPNVEELKATWQKYRNQYMSNTRYFLGKKLSPEHLRQQIVSGYQRHRREASLELALLDQSEILINVEVKIHR